MSGLSWRFAAALGLPFWVFAQQPATIRVPVRLVNIPALVFSSDDRIVPELQVSDFQVLDNGHAQSIRMETTSAPVSVAIVIQANRDVRQYVPFIAKTGSAIEALLEGESGEAAVITYGDDISLIKPFGKRDVTAALKATPRSDRAAHMIDAGELAVRLLRERAAGNRRILLLIGQPADSGSKTTLKALREQVEKENVSVFALTLPLLGKTFVSDNFWLHGMSQGERGGFRTGVDFGKLISVVNSRAEAATDIDPYSVLVAASGGTQLHFRTQRQLEAGIGAIGFQVRSEYLFSYYPGSAEPGFHTVKVRVNVPGAKVYSRPGYWLGSGVDGGAAGLYRSAGVAPDNFAVTKCDVVVLSVV